MGADWAVNWNLLDSPVQSSPSEPFCITVTGLIVTLMDTAGSRCELKAHCMLFSAPVSQQAGFGRHIKNIFSVSRNLTPN